MLLNDEQIRERIEKEGMISPAFLSQVRYDVHGDKVISYGVSSFGYDIQLGYDFKVFTEVSCLEIDPKDFNEVAFVERTLTGADNTILIPPHGFALACSLEWWKIPRDIVVEILGKSTYARCGLIINCTPLEPEWEGHITLELTNSTPLPLKVYAGEGICQAIFHYNPAGCKMSYKDRGGKYQGQRGLTLPRI
jgi:dCTP deaminase